LKRRKKRGVLQVQTVHFGLVELRAARGTQEGLVCSGGLDVFVEADATEEMAACCRHETFAVFFELFQ